jgi:hypothetical protein
MESNCTLPTLSGGIALPSNARGTVVISCFTGYSLRGSSTLRCVGGTWDTPIPTCSKQSYSSAYVRNQMNFTKSNVFQVHHTCTLVLINKQ